MPLPFERRWGSDRRKKDEDGKKEKRDKKKYKTKAEEQMDRQIEELSRQLLEEKHNSRRERLTVTRLQRELTQAKKDNSAKDSLMRDLSKERQSRLEAERRLKEALLESETCKSRLESLQDEFSKMQATMNAVMEYQNNLEQLKQEKNCLVQKYENDLEKCHTRISNLERENSSLTNEIRNLEAKVTHDEGIRERALLLERLKHLEAENTALVLENENQREQYEQCLDEVANQVVQALLMQKDLREECLKLHNRVQELEQQNRNLKCVFDSRGVCFQPNSMPQPLFPHTYGSPSNPLHTGSPLSSPHPCPVSNPGHINKPANGRLDHHSDSMYKTSCESYPASDKTQQQQQQQHSMPSSDNVALSQMYTSHYQSPSSQSRYRPVVLNNKMQLSSHEAFVAQTCSMDRYRFNIPPDATSERIKSLRQHNGAPNTHSIRQGEGSPQRFHSDSRGALSSNGPTLQTSTYRFTLSSLRTNSGDKNPQERNAWNIVASPSSQQRCDREDASLNHRRVMVNGQDSMQLQSVAPVRNGHASTIMVQPKLNGHQNGETRNGYVLSDKYTKPYVHAPFHYAQSLLQELREISSSVKSFESLTLEPKPGTQQKRKAEVHNSGNSRQKLVKGQITLPLERTDSLDSEHGEGYATMPELLDTSTSSLSSASIETTLERVVSLSPTPLSPSWTDEGDTLEISLDDQILDSSLERDCDRSDTEWTSETQDDIKKSSPVKNEKCIYAKTDASKESSSPNHHIEPKLPDCSSSRRQQVSSLEGQESTLEQLLSPRYCQSCNAERQMNQRNWPHKEQYNCQVNSLSNVDHQHSKEDDKTLCNSFKKPSSCCNSDRRMLDTSDDASVEHKKLGKDQEINSNCLSVSNKMDESPKSSKPCSSPFRNHRISLNSKIDTSPTQKSPHAHCLVRKTSSGPNLYPLSPNEDGVCCQSPLICSGPLCTAQKKQMEEEKTHKEDYTKHHCLTSSPTNDAAKMGEDATKASKTSPNRTESVSSTDSIKSSKALAEKTAMAQLNYVTTAEVKLNSGGRNRSRTESSINLSPWVRIDSEEEPSKTVSSLDMTPTPCLVLRSPIKSKVLNTDLKDTSDKLMPCSTKEETVEDSNTNNNDESTSRQADTELPSNSKQADTELPSNKSASIEDQTSNANAQKLEYQKTSYENRIGSFITPSQEETPPVAHSSPKKSTSIPNPDDRPLISANAGIDSLNCRKKSTQPTAYGKMTSPCPRKAESFGKLDKSDDRPQPEIQARSRSLGRNENFPLSGFIKEDNIRIKKTRSLDRDSGRTPSPRRRELMDLPRLDSSPRMPGRNKKAPSKSKDSKLDLKSLPAAKTASQKPSSLKLSLSNSKLMTTKKDNADKSSHTAADRELSSTDKRAAASDKTEASLDKTAPSLDKVADGGGDRVKSSPSGKGTSPGAESPRGITEELIEFRSNSLGENPYLNSVSMESLQSDNSDDWGSPCKSNGSGKKAATPLSEFLSSDSDSEEENINFVEMWKAREASPMKLPEWNPQKSVEEHRKKMRESLSDSNRSSNLDKSSSLSSSTSSEQWLLNYPFVEAPTSPHSKPSSPSKQSRLSFEKSFEKLSAKQSVSDDDVFIVENGPQSLNKLNSVESRKSTASSRSSLGENSVMFDFVSSILDELNKEGVVKVEPGGSPVKQNSRKTEIDQLNRDKSNAIIQNGHCILESQPEVKCNRENLHNKFSDSIQAGQCNSEMEVRPVRTFSLDSRLNGTVVMPPRPANQTNTKSSNSRTNSPSRIPKAANRGTPTSIGQSSKKTTNQRDHTSVGSGEKEKKKESKVKSRIPQLIRNSFRSAISQSGYSKKRDRFPKVDIVRTARSLPSSPLLSRSPKLSPSPKLNGSPKFSPISNFNDEPKQNGCVSPRLSPSPKISRSPHLSKSPRLCASPRMAGSPLLNGSPSMLSNGFSDSMDSLGGSSWNCVHSRKSSVASTSSFGVDNVPYIDDSGSSPESQENKNGADVGHNLDKDGKKPEMQISSPITSAYHGVGAADFRDHFQGKRTNGGLDDQISPEMIEDIKQGRLASNWDSLSLGHQSKSSNYNLKSAYSWSENMSKEQAVLEHEVNGLIDKHKELVECDEDGMEECKEEAEAEPCKVQVPLVDGDMMEDFEVDDMCGDDDTGSIRENAAQLTEKERANLLDSLFESDDSEEESISHSDSMSSDSHPGEKEFMKMLGEKNKVIKHQVIRQHSAVYCRVSIMQVDLCTLYTRFGEKEKEALASFDFLRPFEEETERRRFGGRHMKDHLHSPQRIQIQELDDDDCDFLSFDPMMQDDTSLTGSSDQEPALATESMILGDLMGDSFSSSNRHSYSSSSNSLSSQN